ncbi:hypothetical protein Taro_026765 [Colocasia esculenta]|uniref:Uncharacterized protein n=1 Tax=Colocasia esculenta TaxID=4460 RepID=A0A843VS95_COLES|nr:hypothetical protein [Colocasia esculenta]
MTARSNFKHLMYNARKNAEKVSQSTDPTLWRERAPSWMRGDYWETLCNIWAAERWQQTSKIMKVNRAANPEANMHTGGSVSFATHQSRLEKELKRPPTFSQVFDRTHKKKGTDQYISDRAREVVESYSQQMTEKYAGEDEQPRLDHEVWVAASGAPKKGHVYGFGHSIDTSRVSSRGSSSASQTSAFNAGVGIPGTSPSDMMGFIANTISGLESRLADLMETRLAQMQMQVTDALQAQLSQTLSQVISQTLSQVSIPPPQAAPSTSAHAPHVSSMRRKPFLRTIITYERTINNAPAAQQVALHKWQPNTSDGHGMPFLFQMENQREDPLVGHSCACSRDLFVHLLKIGNFKH